MTRASRKPTVAERLNRELRGGGTLAADRAELLSVQRSARAAEHRRRQAERPPSPRKREIAADRAPITRLARPVMIGPRRRTPVLGYAGEPPEWLLAHLENTDTKGGTDADSTI